MKIVLATRNPGKVRELEALLSDLPVALLTLDAVPGAPMVEEDQPTLRGNARKKAWSLHLHTDVPTLADDTGLEVEVLDGAPGVHSARFAGENADDAANRAVLLERMAGEANRRARFRTVIALAEGREVVFFEGTCEGTLLVEERGAGGFGYDRIFVPRGHTRTFAEMSEIEKNEISHRGKALRRVARYLQTRFQPSDCGV